MIAVLLLTLICIYYRAKNHNWSNPASLMAGIWAFVLLVYELGFVDMYRVGAHIYLIIVLGVLSFAFGTSVAGVVKLSPNNSGESDAPSFYILYKPVLILAFISFLLFIPDTLDSIRILRAGGTFEQLRGDYESVIKSSIILAFMNYIITPFITFLYPVAAYAILTVREKEDRIKKILIFILSIGCAFTQMFSQGGRSAIFYLLVYILVVGALIGKRIKIPRKLKLFLILISVGSFIALYYISLSRGIEDLGSSVINYISGCIPLLSHYIEEISVSENYTCGGAFIYGILQFVFTMLGNIGVPTPAFMQTLSELLNVEANIAISNSSHMNAFVSMFYYFFRDAGYAGVAFESFLYGLLSFYIYKGVKKNRGHMRSLVAYAIITHTIIFSMIRFQLIKYHYILAFIFVFLLIKKTRHTIETKIR